MPKNFSQQPAPVPDPPAAQPPGGPRVPATRVDPTPQYDPRLGAAPLGARRTVAETGRTRTLRTAPAPTTPDGSDWPAPGTVVRESSVRGTAGYNAKLDPAAVEYDPTYAPVDVVVGDPVQLEPSDNSLTGYSEFGGMAKQMQRRIEKYGEAARADVFDPNDPDASLTDAEREEKARREQINLNDPNVRQQLVETDQTYRDEIADIDTMPGISDDDRNRRRQDARQRAEDRVQQQQDRQGRSSAQPAAQGQPNQPNQQSNQQGQQPLTDQQLRDQQTRRF